MIIILKETPFKINQILTFSFSRECEETREEFLEIVLIEGDASLEKTERKG